MEAIPLCQSLGETCSLGRLVNERWVMIERLGYSRRSRNRYLVTTGSTLLDVFLPEGTWRSVFLRVSGSASLEEYRLTGDEIGHVGPRLAQGIGDGV